MIYWKKKINLISWHKKPKKILYDNAFFHDGEVNLAYNCIKTNIKKGYKNKIAIYFINNNHQNTKDRKGNY